MRHSSRETQPHLLQKLNDEQQELSKSALQHPPVNTNVKQNQHKFSHVKFTKPGHIADILQIKLAASGISELRGEESSRKEKHQACDRLCDIVEKYLEKYIYEIHFPQRHRSSRCSVVRCYITVEYV